MNLRILVFGSPVEKTGILAQRLREAGHRVSIRGGSGVGPESGGFDLVLAEIGPDLHELAGLNLSGCPVIAFGEQAGEGPAVEAMRAGAEDYVSLRSPERIVDAVWRILKGGDSRRRREQEELYHRVVEQAAEAIFLVEPESWRIIEANPACERMLGYGTGNLSGVGLEEVVELEDIGRIRKLAGESLEQEGHLSVGYTHRLADGSSKKVEGSLSVISHAGRGVLCFVVYDVTERKWAEDQLRRSVDALLAIYEASQLLSSTLEFEEIGTRLLKIMQRISTLTTAVISVPAEDGRLKVWRAIGFESLWNKARYTPEAQRALYEVLRSGEHRVIELHHSRNPEEKLSTLYLPLRIHEHTLGVLEVYGPDDLTEGQMVEILISLASKAASALENARLYGELAEREKRLQDLVGKLFTAQEEERRRIAYEVHDDLTQMAVAAYQHLQAYAALPEEARGGSRLLEQGIEMVRRTISESRRVIAELRPTELDDFGLAASIRLRAEALREEGWDISYEENLGGERLSPTVETALYRVFQEAITNVRKHAGTRKVKIELARKGNEVSLRVRDWGCGFDPGDLVGEGPGERVGVSGMRERLSLLGGSFDLLSRKGWGTAITARVPVAWQDGSLAGGKGSRPGARGTKIL
ncbi:PAS domain S-box protein [Rubrobacter calidifluminis]|uniref:PAS domain S-box protein n=1 Tax=Rubrobacter calidifluminis TaxID=1392640 RepID=UPI0023616633|nr:PAS domain S-box protein [Rubrobacter calidifluminis]